MHRTRKSHQNMIVMLAMGLACVLSFSATAGQSADPIEVLPNWITGQSVRYEIIKTRRKTQGELVTLNTTARTSLDIEVLSADDEGYTLAWVLGETKFDDPKLLENPLIQQMSNLLKGHRIILELDTQAVIVGVKNWKELQQSTGKMLEVVTKSVRDKGLDEELAMQLRQQITAMFSTKEQIEMLCTREAQLMFMAVGVELVPSEPLTFEDRLPNPFGGEAFPTRAEFTLVDFDPESDRVAIAWHQTFLPDDASRIMEATLKTQAERLGRPVPDGDKIMNFEIEDGADFVFERSTGWIHRATHKRVTTAGDLSQEDTTKFEKKTD